TELANYFKHLLVPCLNDHCIVVPAAECRRPAVDRNFSCRGSTRQAKLYVQLLRRTLARQFDSGHNLLTLSSSQQTEVHSAPSRRRLVDFDLSSRHYPITRDSS